MSGQKSRIDYRSAHSASLRQLGERTRDFFKQLLGGPRPVPCPVDVRPRRAFQAGPTERLTTEQKWGWFKQLLGQPMLFSSSFTNGRAYSQETMEEIQQKHIAPLKAKLDKKLSRLGYIKSGQPQRDEERRVEEARRKLQQLNDQIEYIKSGQAQRNEPQRLEAVHRGLHQQIERLEFILSGRAHAERLAEIQAGKCGEGPFNIGEMVAYAKLELDIAKTKSDSAKAELDSIRQTFVEEMHGVILEWNQRHRWTRWILGQIGLDSRIKRASGDFQLRYARMIHELELQLPVPEFKPPLAREYTKFPPDPLYVEVRKLVAIIQEAEKPTDFGAKARELFRQLPDAISAARQPARSFKEELDLLEMRINAIRAEILAIEVMTPEQFDKEFGAEARAAELAKAPPPPPVYRVEPSYPSSPSPQYDHYGNAPGLTYRKNSEMPNYQPPMGGGGFRG